MIMSDIEILDDSSYIADDEKTRKRVDEWYKQIMVKLDKSSKILIFSSKWRPNDFFRDTIIHQKKDNQY